MTVPFWLSISRREKRLPRFFLSDVVACRKKKRVPTFYSVLEWITIAIPRILNVQDEKTAIDNRFWIWKLLWLCSIDSLSYCGLLGNVPGPGAWVPRMPLVSNSMRNFHRSYFYRASSWYFAIKPQQTKRRHPSRGNRNFRTSRWLDERSCHRANRWQERRVIVVLHHHSIGN